MPGEGRVPSTRNARTADKVNSPVGTGQHMPGTTATKQDAPTRNNDSPSKSSSVSTKTADASVSVTIQRDDAPKTSREREFRSWTSAMGPNLDGAVTDKGAYPSPYERGTLGEISKGDKYAGTASKVSKPKNQAQ